MAKSKSSKTKVKSILVIYRKDTPDALKLAMELSDWLLQKRIKVYCHPKQKINSNVSQMSPRNLSKIDLVIVLGGDGTYLEAVRLLNGRPTPILGVNLGSLGFLTQVRAEQLYTAASLALEGKLEKRPRSMIQVKVKSKGKVIEKFTSLNDVVIERGPFSQLLNLSMYSRKQHVSDVKADGLIIATPTGSTAYNLSAGGPILHPHVSAFVITPICPHSLTNRPLIFPDSENFSFRLRSEQQKAVVTVDGVNRCQISSAEELELSKAKCFHYVLRKPSHNYFKLLREKLKFGERASL